MAPSTAVIVTGASGGFGLAVATQFGAEFKENVAILLLGRKLSALQQAAEAVKATGATVAVAEVDVGQLDNLVGKLDTAVHTQYTEVYLVNNAATLGDLKHKISEYDPAEVATYMTINVSSPMIVSGWFLRTFAATAKKRVLVNVSSLLAVKPFPYWGLYATGKAARDHMHACIAAESGPDVRTLNYAPGPLNGGMQNRVRVELGDPEQRGLYASMHAEGKLVPMEASAAKLVRILREDVYTSGAHVDYFDEYPTGTCPLEQ